MKKYFLIISLLSGCYLPHASDHLESDVNKSHYHSCCGGCNTCSQPEAEYPEHSIGKYWKGDHGDHVYPDYWCGKRGNTVKKTANSFKSR